MLLPKLLLILLIHQQFLCHATWATRTNATAATTATTTPTPSPSAASAAAPLVSSSEATLLTTRGSPVVVAAQRQRQRPLYVDDAYEDDDDDDVAATGDSDHVNEIGTTSSAAAAKPTSAAEERVPLVSNVAAASSTKASAASAASPPMAKTAKSRYKITSVETSCTRDLFEMRIELNRGFRGLLYAKDFPFECRARGSSNTNITLRLPTSGCGVRSEPRPDGTMELSVRVMLQMEEKLRQSSDILRTVRCQLPLTAMGMTLMGGGGAAGVGKTRKTWRNGRMRSLGAASGDDSLWTSEEQTTTVPDPSAAEQSPTTTTATSAGSASSPSSSSPSTPRVRIWLELGGPDGSGAVEVGQATTLTVRAIVPGTMGVRVVDCAALDGLGDSTQQLLDERGCPIDEQVMPALHTRFKPAEEGWSKQDEDDLVEKTFAATFPAFKFPDRERLHVSCGVQLCKGKCPNINCRTAEKLILSPDKHLARIEVFNSLAVTAPQIEVDRLRYDRRYNMSVEEYPPNVRPIPSEGTLCLSVSKLALSFCVLGLIFLVAIVVAICSLIRSRRRAANGCGLTSTTRSLNRPEMCTSMFSSSSESAHSARFGSKLFIPYYPNTLPYGRVY